MEKNKYTLYSIIILLIIFVPCSIYGTYMHFVGTANLNKDFKFNNKLYFYDNDKLLGTYECQSDDCDYAKYANNQSSSMINSKYAFIVDNGKIHLYNIIDGEITNNYDEVDILSDGIYKIRQDKVWGVVRVSSTVENLLDCSYNEITFQNNKFIALKNDEWFVYQGRNELFTSKTKIKGATNDFVIVSVNNVDKLYDYNKKEYIDKIIDKNLAFIDDLVLVKRNYNYQVYSFTKGNVGYTSKVINNFNYAGTASITYKINGTTVELYANDQLLNSFELIK